MLYFYTRKYEKVLRNEFSILLTTIPRRDATKSQPKLPKKAKHLKTEKVRRNEPTQHGKPLLEKPQHKKNTQEYPLSLKIT